MMEATPRRNSLRTYDKTSKTLEMGVVLHLLETRSRNLLAEIKELNNGTSRQLPCTRNSPVTSNGTRSNNSNSKSMAKLFGKSESYLKQAMPPL